MGASFTYEQAEEICEDFTDLEGTELIIHTDRPVKCDIEHVCISPFERNSIETFLEDFAALHDVKQALDPYKGDAYNVIIIARNAANADELIIQTIEEYIEANGVRYNFP